MANTFKNKKSRNIGTAPIQIGSYIVAANTQSTAIGLTLANVANTTIQVSVSLYDGSVDYFIVKQANIVPGGSLVAIGGNQKLVMETGNSIRISSTLANSVDAILSVLEIT